jgi:hypothetical protein
VNGRVPPGPARPDRSHSRFLCNTPRKLSLAFGAVAFGALVIGGGFAEISTNGSPTSLETAIIRWVILGSLVAAVVAYVIGGRRLDAPRRDRGSSPGG